MTEDLGIIAPAIVGSNIDTLLTRKDLEELVLILKGESTEQFDEEAALLTDLIRSEVEARNACSLTKKMVVQEPVFVCPVSIE
jgi:hypothetical protein